MLHLLSDFILKKIFISKAENHTTNEVIDFRPGGAFLVLSILNYLYNDYSIVKVPGKPPEGSQFILKAY